ncbi:uncharacterized protein PFL1_04123 [Pseudozyma flocculosa PF-1]|uniref:Related to DNA Polymerase iota (POLI) n=2 Tax=Pseudozyma flocculosa TaxID=84751 RepID=A0A5C3EWG0_9BASI|nr:uncharacterized protein PFL1_04123 [Pseudozyma flocculosa PF-1]EPQ28296.1 hypothetical protein PFL1_04123 [Pseudozyma flocculosa PF-1]SPO35441.1 related to DNA Polymerase iota (POLI) [Pseudozyma flocculosa]
MGDHDTGRSPAPKRIRTAYRQGDGIDTSADPQLRSELDDQGRLIVALDLDAFYVAAARKRDPSLIGLPIGIQQKGLLATISYEARAMGVRKLASISDAIKQCPEMILVNGEDLSYFRLVSNQVWRLVRGIVWDGRVEKLGMDELFCDVTEMVDAHLASLPPAGQHDGRNLCRFDIRKRQDGQGRGSASASSSSGFDYAPWPTLPQGHVLPSQAADKLRSSAPDRYQQRLFVAAHLASYLRQQVSDKIGLTCSAGVAHSKMLAKLVGAKNKPNQQTTFAPRSIGRDPIRSRLDQVQELLDPLDLGQINGFGRVAVDKIRTALLEAVPAEQRDARSRLTVGATRKAASMSLMTGIFGARVGERLWHLACGIDREPVVPAPEFPIQISIEDTYPGIRGQEIHDQILVLSESLLRRLEAELIKENRDASLDGIRHEAVSSSQELQEALRTEDVPGSATSAPDMQPPPSRTAQVAVRGYREVADAIAPVSGTKGEDTKTWLRYPLRVRLSVRQGWNSRITKQASMPVQIFDLSISRRDRAKVLYKACRALLRALIGGDDVVGESMNLINIAALDLVEQKPTKALESFFAAAKAAPAAPVAGRRREPAIKADVAGSTNAPSTGAPGGGPIDLDFVAALPEDLRVEVMREYGLSLDPKLAELGTEREEAGPPEPEPPPLALPSSSSTRVAGAAPSVERSIRSPSAPPDDEGLLCPRCRLEMPVWMQHDHDTWPATGLPPHLVVGGGAEDSASEDLDLDCERGEGRDNAHASIEASSDEDTVCRECEALVPSWMLLAHARFHELDTSQSAKSE